MKLTLEAVAALTGGKILSGDPELTVFGVASLLDASREEASFLGNEKYFQDFLHTSAGIVLVPPGLPAATTDKMRRDIEKALAEPDVLEKFKSFGYEPFTTTRPQFAQFVKDESQRFADVIKKANVSLD